MGRIQYARAQERTDTGARRTHMALQIFVNTPPVRLSSASATSFAINVLAVNAKRRRRHATSNADGATKVVRRRLQRTYAPTAGTHARTHTRHERTALSQAQTQTSSSLTLG